MLVAFCGWRQAAYSAVTVLTNRDKIWGNGGTGCRPSSAYKTRKLNSDKVKASDTTDGLVVIFVTFADYDWIIYRQ